MADTIGQQGIGGNGNVRAGQVSANGGDEVGQSGMKKRFAAGNVDGAEGAGELGKVGGGEEVAVFAAPDATHGAAGVAAMSNGNNGIGRRHRKVR